MMRRFRILPLACAGLHLAVVLVAKKPNIVVILTDDQGYADISYSSHSPKGVNTPRIDALAKAGVVCTQGYVTGHVCSPTRAGLMTGHHQQRFGIYTAGEGGSGVPLDEKFFPQYLKPAGYACGAFGKWHLGLTLEYNAVSRGFDEFYGFMGRGAHDYFDLNTPGHPIYRGLKPIKDEGYLTDRITDEAVAFIKRRKGEPFFAYVAFNAVHSPAQAPKELIGNETESGGRNILLAMLRSLDEGVGRIVDALKAEGLFENTLIFFLTDNGGSKVMQADNSPLRGFKQQDYEGGVRVPFAVCWPVKLKAGETCDVPVTSLDILPTALAAAGLETPPEAKLDGKNMLPTLLGETNKLHENLYWSSGGNEGKWAIRSGKWKLVGQKALVELFDLDEDLSETKDLSKQFPDKVAVMTKLHQAWLADMADPVNGGGKRWNPENPAPSKAERKRLRDKKREERQRERLNNKSDQNRVP